MKAYILIIVIICTIIYSGCEKSGETASSNSTSVFPYYLEAYLQTGKYATVHISQTTSLSTTQNVSDFFAMDSDIVVRFYSHFHALLLKDGLVVDSLTGPYDDNYVYWRQANFFWGNWYFLKGNKHVIQQGGNYQMVVKLQGHPNMIASCIVPDVVPIKSLDTVNNRPTSSNHFLDSLLQTSNVSPVFILTFQDPPGRQNYYGLECFSVWKSSYYRSRNITGPITYNWNLVVLQDNPIFDNHWNDNTTWTYWPSLGFFSDKLFEGQTESFGFSAGSSVEDSLIAVHLVSLSEGYYQRLLTTYLFMMNSINMYSSPVPIYSNFSNAVGFLAGRTVASDTFNLVTKQIYYQSNNIINNTVIIKH